MTSRTTLSCVVLFLSCTLALGQLPPTPTGEPDASAKPRLLIQHRLVELGDVLEGDTATVSWKLENRGGADLVINQIKAACGCTVIKDFDGSITIPPGGEYVLKAEFNSSGRRGEERKGVSIFSNDPAEPKSNVKFTAKVKWLYQIKPTASILHLRSLQRGQKSDNPIEIWSSPGQKEVEIVSVEFESGSFTHTIAPFNDPNKAIEGQRISISVGNDVPLGVITDKVYIKLRVGDYERTRHITLKAKIVGDLVVRPVVVDLTRSQSRRGQRLAPVSVRSPNKMPFRVIKVEAGPLLEVTTEPGRSNPPNTEHLVRLKIREDAPPGPFATTLKIHTDSIDQPLMQIPIFGAVAPLLEIEPPVILLRKDGTPKGIHRLLSLQAPVQETLKITEMSCSNEAVTATPAQGRGVMLTHKRFIDVKLEGNLPSGTTHATLTVKTNLAELPVVEIPVTIVVP